MEEALRSILGELERFGTENDASKVERQEKMLNITRETGEFLAILALSVKAKRVLEIGTSNGYSTLWLADAMRATSGEVVTVEISPTKAEMARRNLERAGLTRWVRQKVMGGSEFLSQQSGAAFDVVFLDSNRAEYVAWWPGIQRAIVPGGLLVVDNAISHPAEMEAFTEQVRLTPGWRSVVVPIGKGELLAVKARFDSNGQS